MRQVINSEKRVEINFMEHMFYPPRLVRSGGTVKVIKLVSLEKIPAQKMSNVPAT